jgi:hypothetical protein
MVMLWILEALLILFVATGICLISTMVLLGTSILLLAILWTYLDAHRMTPPYWTPLGLLQAVITILLLIPHIQRYVIYR